MQENPVKVAAKVQELNRKLGAGWLAVPGFNAITGFNFGLMPGQGPNFNPASGYPVKIFVNNVTGEIKVYTAYLFVG